MAEFIFYAGILVAALARYHWRKNDDAFDQVHNDTYKTYDEIISSHIPFYNALSAPGKHRFVYRTNAINNQLRIEGREEFEVTDEVRILICACLTQLTWGFRNPGLPFLKGVLVFPDEFYSRLARSWVKGLAMNNGVVFLSWRDFLHGYEFSTNTYNLGLHEFTHMLKMQSDEGMTGDKRIVDHYDTWNELAHEVFQRVRSKDENFFREYAGTNTSEFLSVCVENFFEIPEAFEKELPEIYYHLCYLLNQNPLNAINDYALTESDIYIINQKIKKDLPVNKTLISISEQRFWFFASQMIWFIAFVDVMILAQSSLSFQLIILRMSLMCVGIFIVMRWLYYKNLRDALHYSYLFYLSRLIPLLLVLMVIIAAIGE